MEISLVIPVYNEEKNIAPLLSEIKMVLCGIEYEVIYVDDGSTDKTLQRLRDISNSFPHLRVIRHKKCCGQSTAVLTGVRHARAPLIATLDGDGQNDPADIPGMLQVWRREEQTNGKPIGCIAGWRTKRRDNGLRKLSSKVANAVRSRLLGDNTPDTGCGLKLFSREIYLRFPYFDHMHRFLPALFLREGTRVISKPVNHRSRERGTSKYGLHNRLWVGLVDIMGVMWLLNRANLPEIIED